jgi:RadC-like JAB domain
MITLRHGLPIPSPSPSDFPGYKKRHRFNMIVPERGLVHNHPSGDTTPSKADIDMTRAVAKALAAIGIALHDHVVLGRGRHASFKSLGLL